jgi:hypothetical protein
MIFFTYPLETVQELGLSPIFFSLPQESSIVRIVRALFMQTLLCRCLNVGRVLARVQQRKTELLLLLNALADS